MIQRAPNLVQSTTAIWKIVFREIIFLVSINFETVWPGLPTPYPTSIFEIDYGLKFFSEGALLFCILMHESAPQKIYNLGTNKNPFLIMFFGGNENMPICFRYFLTFNGVLFQWMINFKVHLNLLTAHLIQQPISKVQIPKCLRIFQPNNQTNLHNLF